MPFDASDPAFMDPTTRKGEFREVARDIVWKDRQSRKYGPTEDTGGRLLGQWNRHIDSDLSTAAGLSPRRQLQTRTRRLLGSQFPQGLVERYLQKGAKPQKSPDFKREPALHLAASGCLF